MRKFKQFDALDVQDFEEQDFHLPAHGQNYYELVYIYHGKGRHVLNQVVMTYTAGDLFVIAPGDEHCFEIEERTRIIAIKFTDDYFSSKDHWKLQDYVYNNPESIMNTKMLKEVKLVFDETVKIIMQHTIDNILLYHKIHDASSSPIIFYQILSIFGMIKEGMGAMEPEIHATTMGREKLISYIHQNIYEPDKTKIQSIASYFNIAPNYFSAYFKRNFEISYRAYINQYRMVLIDKRMHSGQFTLKQIAEEFGFTDESHFSHFYKKQKGVSPSRSDVFKHDKNLSSHL